MGELFQNNPDVVIRILVAALLGGLIGLERDKHGRAAGLRTHLLVSMGSAVFTILSAEIAHRTQGAGFAADPGRIAAQIVTGIGFLGAGVILKSGNNVRGLTTAACLWAAAGIGMAAGSGFYFIAGFSTLVALAGLVLLKFFERTYAKDSYRTLSVVTPIEVSSSEIIEAVMRPNLVILNCDIDRDFDRGTAEARLTIRLYHKGITDKLAHGIISSLETSGIQLKQVRWNRS